MNLERRCSGFLGGSKQSGKLWDAIPEAHYLRPDARSGKRADPTAWTHYRRVPSSANGDTQDFLDSRFPRMVDSIKTEDRRTYPT